MDRITDRPDMTSAVDSGRKASTQTKLKINLKHALPDQQDLYSILD